MAHNREQIRCETLRFFDPGNVLVACKLPLDAHPEAAFPLIMMRNWPIRFNAENLRLGPSGLVCWIQAGYPPRQKHFVEALVVYDWRRGRLAKVRYHLLPASSVRLAFADAPVPQYDRRTRGILYR